jgi:uncharacterized protein (TIGR03437 family)
MATRSSEYVSVLLKAPAKPKATVSLQIGGKTATDVAYAGAAPYAVAGALQVNVKIPDGAGSGPVPVKLMIGGQASAGGVTISLR